MLIRLYKEIRIGWQASSLTCEILCHSDLASSQTVTAGFIRLCLRVGHGMLALDGGRCLRS